MDSVMVVSINTLPCLPVILFLNRTYFSNLDWVATASRVLTECPLLSRTSCTNTHAAAPPEHQGRALGVAGRMSSRLPLPAIRR